MPPPSASWNTWQVGGSRSNPTASGDPTTSESYDIFHHGLGASQNLAGPAQNVHPLPLRTLASASHRTTMPPPPPLPTPRQCFPPSPEADVLPVDLIQNKRSRKQNPADELWALHKQDIKTLYLTKKMSLTRTIQEMERKHQFSASYV
jgi:hypothetical protein